MLICNTCGNPFVDETLRFCNGCGAPVPGVARNVSAKPSQPAHGSYLSDTPLRVFLCHSSSDEEVVLRLYKQLLQDGFQPWAYEKDLLPGQVWREEVTKVVRSSDVVVVCLSPEFVRKAGFGQTEIQIALDVAAEQPEDTIFIIPLKLVECDIPQRLNRWQCESLFTENGYERLKKALRHRAARLKPPPHPDPPLKPRRVDAAVPTDASVGEPLDLLVQVRLPSSPLLGSENWPPGRRPPSVTQTSAETKLRFPVDRRTGTIGPAKLEINVIAPDFEIGGAPRKFIEVPLDQASEMVRFLLTARQIGTCKINVEVYSGDQIYLGAIPLETNVARGSLARSQSIAQLVLAVMVEPTGQLVDTINSSSYQDEGSTGVAPNVRDSETADSSGAESRSHRLRLKVLMALISIVAVLMAAAYWRFVHDQPVTGPAKIAITEIPPYDPVGGPDTSANIAGVASGVDFRDVRIVIYSFTDKWYVQPSEAEPFISVGSDGRWNSTVRTGTKYAALLVRSTFKPRTKIPNLPDVEGEVLAIQIELGRQ